MLRGVLVFLALFALTVPLAAGHPNPPGCTQSALSFDWGLGLNSVKRNGDIVPITAMVGNNQIPTGVCDVTDATVTLTFPNSDGTENGQQFLLATDVDFPAGSAKKSFPTRNLTVNFDPGVFRGFVTISVSGIVHASDDPETAGPISSAGRPAVISRPHVTLTVTPDDPGPGSAPFPVTYTYTALNDSPADPAGPISNPTPSVVNLAITDDVCSPVVWDGVDPQVTDPVLLQPGETWTFTCSTSLRSGPVINHAHMTGGSTRDGRPWPATTAESTVTVNGPDMTLAKSHTQTFTQGDSGRIYKIVATNTGNAPSTGLVTVTEKPPGALKPKSLSGTGWHCTLSTLKCTRSNALAAGASYPAITFKVDVKGSAPANIVNKATISRAGEHTGDDTALDPTAVARAKCDGVVATIVGSQRADTIRGTNHRDIIAALGGNDVVHGRGGNDLICGGSGADSLFGGPGRDRLLGGPGRDLLQQ